MVVRNLPTDDDGLMLKDETGTGAINRPGGKYYRHDIVFLELESQERMCKRRTTARKERKREAFHDIP